MRPVKKIKKSPTFAFVVDGKTEIWYLQMFKKHEQRERGIYINIDPKIPQRNKVSEQFQLACEKAKSEYDKVFWIVDLDVILKETRESKSNESPLNEFISILHKLENSEDGKRDVYDKINVIVNNPCLEYWFLLHFRDSGKSYANCSKVESQLKNHLSGYEKTERYFKSKSNDIYTRLKPYLNNAISNAEKLGGFDKKNPIKGMCEMNKLFLCDELRNYFED